MELAILLGIANIALLFFLLSVYVPNYKALKSGFGLGLILFSRFLLLENAMSLYGYFSMHDAYAAAMQQESWVTIAQTAGLLVLAFVTWKE